MAAPWRFLQSGLRSRPHRFDWRMAIPAQEPRDRCRLVGAFPLLVRQSIGTKTPRAKPSHGSTIPTRKFSARDWRGFFAGDCQNQAANPPPDRVLARQPPEMSRSFKWANTASYQPEWVVADAVVVEPVSTSKFPADREKNKEFCKSGAPDAIFAHSRPANSVLCSKIPYEMGREFFGKIDGTTRNGHAGNEEHAYAGWALKRADRYTQRIFTTAFTCQVARRSGHIAQRTGAQAIKLLAI